MAFTTTATGLQYEDTETGSGAEATSGQGVSVHYTGWLYENGVQGKKFDSSVDRSSPFEFSLGAGMVIKGWDEGVQGMKVGGKRTLIIPAELGYGARGAGGVIPANATLKFDVELLEIEGGEMEDDDSDTGAGTSAGLLIDDTEVGTGTEATRGTNVSVHYTGWLYENGTQGKKFDSSLDRNSPFDFPLGGGMVIKGWDEGVQGMKVGGKRTLIIPPHLGYGARGAGGVIPGNATLKFDVVLLGVN
jgi:FKBP-type peptidyl-prolyl cis-trans isomerase